MLFSRVLDTGGYFKFTTLKRCFIVIVITGPKVSHLVAMGTSKCSQLRRKFVDYLETLLDKIDQFVLLFVEFVAADRPLNLC